MSRKRIHNIVFNDGIDGIVSAALYLYEYVKKDENYILYPVSSFSKGEKFDTLVKSINLNNNDTLIILDYEYHSKSSLWVNHHYTHKIGEDTVLNNKILYDPKSKSASELMSLVLSDSDKWRKINIKNIIKEVNMIEKSDYPSMESLFTNTNPLMILRAYIERSFSSEMMLCRIIELIVRNNFNLHDTLIQLKLDNRVILDLQKDVEKARNEIVIFGNCSIIRQSRVGKHPRYSEFYLHPEVKYGIRFSRLSKNRLYFQIGYNKWHIEPNTINICQMISSIKYLIKKGGTYNLGGGILDESNSERFLDDLSITLNPEGDIMGISQDEEMEKTAVDPTDPVEKKADEMVKNGSAVDKDEAREKAAEIPIPTIGNPPVIDFGDEECESDAG